MEVRKKAIQSHLKPFNLPSTLLDEATFIGLDCNKKLTKLTKICAAIGLILASTNRGQALSPKTVAEQLDIKYRNLSKHFSRMKTVPTQSFSKKKPKLEEILEKVDAEPETRAKAYALIESKSCTTALQAVQEALTGCNGLNLLTRPGSEVLPAKHNKNQLLASNAELRIQSLIIGQPVAFETLPSLDLLGLEKSVLAKALGITYYNCIG